MMAGEGKKGDVIAESDGCAKKRQRKRARPEPARLCVNVKRQARSEKFAPHRKVAEMLPSVGLKVAEMFTSGDKP